MGKQLRASLENFLVSGTIDIREGGGRVSSSQPLFWEVRGSLERPLLHLWSDHCNLTRRVLSIAAKSDDRLALAVEQFGRSKAARMEIVRVAYSRNPGNDCRVFLAAMVFGKNSTLTTKRATAADREFRNFSQFTRWGHAPPALSRATRTLDAGQPPTGGVPHRPDA